MAQVHPGQSTPYKGVVRVLFGQNVVAKGVPNVVPSLWFLPLYEAVYLLLSWSGPLHLRFAIQLSAHAELVHDDVAFNIKTLLMTPCY